MDSNSDDQHELTMDNREGEHAYENGEVNHEEIEDGEDAEKSLHKHVSEIVIEDSVEMKMYKCLKEKNYEAFVELVETEGGDINHVFDETFVDLSNSGWTALHFVCKRGKEEHLQLLLGHGADPSLSDKKGNTPLHMVCKYGHFKLCQLILENNNAVKDKQNLQGLTPLLKAIFRSDTAFKVNDYDKTITSLIEAGCDVNLRPKSNMSALHVLAGKWKSVDMVQKLLHAGADINADTGTSSPLMTALSRPRVDTTTVLALIAAGADVNYRNPNLKSVLHIAVSKSEDICVEHLLIAGADPNVEDGDGNTPLWIAVTENDIKIAPLLLHHGGNVNFRNPKYGMSLLCKATFNRNKKMVKLLLDHKADINLLTKLGGSALHYAIDQGDLDIIKMLLRENPDLENYSMFKNLYNPQNAFQIALAEGNSFVIKLLLVVGAPVPFYMTKLKRLPSIVRDDEELVEWMYDYLCNPRSLQHLCRIEFRKYCRPNINTVVESLTRDNLIPKRVGDKILLKDILDNNNDCFDDEFYDV